MTGTMITIGFDYAVGFMNGVACLVHADVRIKPIRVSQKNAQKINRRGEGHFIYGEVVEALGKLRGSK